MMYPDVDPLPWSAVVMPQDIREPNPGHEFHFQSNARRAQITRVPEKCGTPRLVITRLALWCTRDLQEVVGPCHLLLNAFRWKDGKKVRGASVQATLKSPGGLILGTHELILKPIHVWLGPGQRANFKPHATTDPTDATDLRWAPTVSDPIDITSEVAEWVFHGFPATPSDPNAPYAWEPTTKSMSIELKCEFDQHISDLDLTTGEEIFLRNAVNIGASGSVEILP